ncbi:unnamed protein product [Pieris brassicae]|uniref:Partial AB-hydrolase lipase domain-containing protein n=1 Tax=Pieris brassicae TaxID=7116 RepID=A0A9P0X321_PIEBR|nr:unnamed protein product [Pieris brassicae]
MWFKTFLTIVVLISVEANNVCDINSKVLKAGYPFEKYDLVTEDGYILEVYRIPYGKNETQGHRPVVFMMHGLLSSASSFVELGPNYAMAHLIAGVGYKRNFPNLLLSSFATYTSVLYDFVRTLGLHELKYEWIASDNEKPAEIGEYKVSLRDLGTSASLKQLSHFGQNVRDKTFRRWDYSLLENFFHYGSPSPPEYNLRRVNVDITMHYTIADSLLDERDVLAMVNDLPNAKARKIPKDNFSHYDFVQSSFVKPLVTDYIISDLKSR